MPPKPRITREMILDAAYAIARAQGAECINARTIAERLHCSTQPVLYWFDHVEDIRRAVYEKADEYHSEWLMSISPEQDPMIAIGLNYICFAAEEKQLFRLLFQSDGLHGQSVTALLDLPELTPVLSILQQGAGLNAAQAKQVFKGLLLLVHGWASMLANNAMPYDEAEIVPMLRMAFYGMIGALKTEDDAG